VQESSAGSHAGKGAGRGDVVEREGGSCSSVPLEQSTYSKPAEGLTAHSAPTKDSRSSRTRRSLHRSDKHLSETARCTTSRRGKAGARVFANARLLDPSTVFQSVGEQ